MSTEQRKTIIETDGAPSCHKATTPSQIVLSLRCPSRCSVRIGNDIAGKNKASADSMRNAIYTVIDIYRNRKLYKIKQI